jgi:hypothetical protein
VGDIVHHDFGALHALSIPVMKREKAKPDAKNSRKSGREMNYAFFTLGISGIRVNRGRRSITYHRLDYLLLLSGLRPNKRQVRPILYPTDNHRSLPDSLRRAGLPSSESNRQI